jgi:regulator of cell morphogenesis and NO signaling
MIAIKAETTLGDVVGEHPHLAQELEQRGLDYCCGGGRTLAEACRAAGLDAGTVVADLTAVDPPNEGEAWSDLGPAELADHIEAVHHWYLWEELPRLTALGHKAALVHGDRHPELADVLVALAALRAELEPHLVKEERVLFPMIHELARAQEQPSFHCGSITNPISVMMREHDRAGELLRRLQVVTDGYRPPADACASYRAFYDGLRQLELDTHMHVHKENHALFPAVVQLEQGLPR